MTVAAAKAQAGTAPVVTATVGAEGWAPRLVEVMVAHLAAATAEAATATAAPEGAASAAVAQGVAAKAAAAAAMEVEEVSAGHRMGGAVGTRAAEAKAAGT